MKSLHIFECGPRVVSSGLADPRESRCHAVGDSRLTRRGTTHSRDLSGRGTARAEDAQGTPTQSHIYEEYGRPARVAVAEGEEVPGDGKYNLTLNTRSRTS